MSLRMDKINSEIRKQITIIIMEEIDDPACEMISITSVKTIPDLSESKIYFSMLDETKIGKAQSVLNAMNKFIRLNLAKRVRLKFIPELKFIHDDSIKYSVDIYKKIEEVRSQEELRKNKTNPDFKEDLP
ncbi:MAG: 30S ribosome-binding factor RbfA [Candidatus Omnitrophota bacterium]